MGTPRRSLLTTTVINPLIGAASMLGCFSFQGGQPMTVALATPLTKAENSLAAPDANRQILSSRELSSLYLKGAPDDRLRRIILGATSDRLRSRSDMTAIAPEKVTIQLSRPIFQSPWLRVHHLTTAKGLDPAASRTWQAIQTATNFSWRLNIPHLSTIGVADDRTLAVVSLARSGDRLPGSAIIPRPSPAIMGTEWDALCWSVVLSGLKLLGVLSFGIWLMRRLPRSSEQPELSISTITSSLALPQSALIREIKTLRLAFISMLAKTKAQQQEIEQFHAEYARSLEAEIANRTLELRRTTAQLHAAQRIAKVGSWEFDLVTQQVTWSAEIYRIVGRSPLLEVTTVAAIYDLCAPTGAAAFKAAVEQAITTGASYTLEQALTALDGTQRYVINRGEVERNGQEQIVRIVRLVGTFTDITERKVAELALAASEASRRQALELTQTGSWEFNIQTGQTTWSDSHYRLIGLSPNAVPPSYQAWRERVHTDDLAFATAAIQTAIAQRTLLSIEYRVVHPNGQVRWVLTRGQAVYDLDGTPQKMVGVMMDISDRKQLEIDLQASESQLSSVLDSAQATILRARLQLDCTLQLDYVSQNCRQLYGFEAAALTANSSLWQSRFAEADWQTVILPLYAQLAKTPHQRQELMATYRYCHPDGSLRYILTHLSAEWHGHEQYWDLTIVDTNVTELKRTEQALQALSQELQDWRNRYEVATTSGKQIVFEYDMAKDQYTFSQNASQILACAVDDLPQTLAAGYAIVHPQDLPILQTAIATAEQSLGQSFCIEIRLRRGDGTYLWVEDQAMLQIDACGHPVKIIGSLKDISDRKQTEQALAVSEAKYRGIYNQAAIGIGYADAQGIVLGCNQTMLEMFGYSQADFIGTSIQSLTHPDCHSDQTKLFQQLYNGVINAYTQERRYQRQDGSTLWGNTTVSLLRSPDGTPLHTIAIIQDVNDRKQFEAALKESRAKYQRLVDHIGEKFVVFSHTGEYGILTYVSDGVASVFGLQRADVIGKTWQQVVNWHPQTLESTLIAIQQMLTKEVKFQQFEMRFTHPDGSSRSILVSQHPVVNQQGELLAIEGIVEDITDRKQAEAELQLLNAQLQELATTDSLTKVANRRQFLTTLAQEWPRHQRESLPLTIVMLDIDHFKAFNDTYGHPVGDRCLTQIAKVLRQCMQRPSDLVARYGGEEFMVLLPNTNKAGAIAIIRRILDQIATLTILHETSPTANYVTVSLGVLVINMPTEIDEADAIAIADQQLYAAKQVRNTYCLEVIG